jgi:hypothetical protein
MPKRNIDDDDDVSSMLTKCNLNTIDIDELDFGQLDLEDPHEYDMLKDSCCRVYERSEMIRGAVKRYHRYLEGITDWLGFECIREDIKVFLRMHYEKKDPEGMIKISRSVDKALFAIINNFNANAKKIKYEAK